MAESKKIATRESFGMALCELAKTNNDIIVFDADLAAATKTSIFKKEFDSILTFLNKSQKAKIILSTGFWRHPGDNVIVEYAKENNLPCVELGDLGEREEMRAIGLFEHSGVANHPGDLGMKNIAERVFNVIKESSCLEP
jgi:hypothetical protein